MFASAWSCYANPGLTDALVNEKLHILSDPTLKFFKSAERSLYMAEGKQGLWSRPYSPEICWAHIEQQEEWTAIFLLPWNEHCPLDCTTPLKDLH